MKVFHIITGLGLGGAETTLYQLILNTKKEVNHVILSLTPLNTTLSNRLSSHGFKVYSVELNSSKIQLQKIFNLYKIVKHENPDLLQTWMYHSDFIGGIIGRLLQIPVVWCVRQDSPTISYNGWKTFIISFLCALFSRLIPSKIICNSKSSIANHIKFGYSKTKFIYIPNGYSEIKIQENQTKGVFLEIHEGDFIFGHVGRFHPVKNHLSFIDVMKRVIKKFPHVKCVMVGNKVDYNNVIITNRIGDAFINNFILLGEQDNMNAVYPLFDVLIMNSLSESFPNVVAESMNNSIPCIVTNAGDAYEIVNHTGWHVKNNNQDDLEDKVIEVLSLPKLSLKEMGLIAKERISNDFNLDKMCKQYFSLWVKIVNK